MVTVAAGSATTTVTIDPTADTKVEPDETVVLTVSSGTDYNAGSPSAATGTITIDDSSAISLAVAPCGVAEYGSTTLVYTFTRDHTSSETPALTVSFSVGGSATFGSD